MEAWKKGRNDGTPRNELQVVNYVISSTVLFDPDMDVLLNRLDYRTRPATCHVMDDIKHKHKKILRDYVSEIFWNYVCFNNRMYLKGPRK